MASKFREPEVYDAVEAPPGYVCQQWHSRDGGESPTKCENDADVLFVYEASIGPDDDRRKNCLGCVECAPIRPEDIRSVEPENE